DVVVQRVGFAVAELQFLGPVQLLAFGIVARLGRPADQLYGLVTVLFAPDIGLVHIGLHILEHVAVVDVGGVLVGHITAVFVLDGHAPGFVGQRRYSGRQDHAQRQHIVRWVAPAVDQQTLG